MQNLGSFSTFMVCWSLPFFISVVVAVTTCWSYFKWLAVGIHDCHVLALFPFFFFLTPYRRKGGHIRYHSSNFYFTTPQVHPHYPHCCCYHDSSGWWVHVCVCVWTEGKGKGKLEILVLLLCAVCALRGLLIRVGDLGEWRAIPLTCNSLRLHVCINVYVCFCAQLLSGCLWWQIRISMYAHISLTTSPHYLCGLYCYFLTFPFLSVAVVVHTRFYVAIPLRLILSPFFPLPPASL